jgi:breakpoint cluster region protein
MTPLGLLGVDKDVLWNIFSNVEVIRNLHTKLLERLREAMSEWGPASTIGDVFLKDVEWIKLYKYYVNNFENARETLGKCMAANAQFRSYVEVALPSHRIPFIHWRLL